MTPQIYTTETLAVRGLAAIIEAYPGEATLALTSNGINLSGAIDPRTVRPERARSDLPLGTDAGESVHIEVKIDDHANDDQLRKLHEKYPEAHVVLLVADAESPDVEVIDPDVFADITILEWGVFLSAFTSPHVRRLQADVTAIVTNPCSKRSQRYALRSALAQVDVPDPAWNPHIEPTDNRRPAVLLNSPCGNVRAQLEVTGRNGVLHYTPGIGFRYREGQADDEITTLLHKVMMPLEAAEFDGEFTISRARSLGSRWEGRGFEEKPWFTRGYANDYIGVKLKTTPDAADALEQLYSAFKVFEMIALSN